MSDAELELAEPAIRDGEIETAPAKVPGATVVVFRSTLPGPKGGPIPESSAALQPVDNSWLGDLAVIEIATGRVRILAPRIRSNRYLFSPDGSQVAYLDCKARLNQGPDASIYTYVFDLIVLELGTAQSRAVAHDIRQWGGVALSWSPDGRWLAYVSGSGTVPDSNTDFFTFKDVYTFRGDLYVVPSGSGSSRKFDGAPAWLFDTGASAPPFLWDETGEHLYLIGGDHVWQATVATGRLSHLAPTLDDTPKAIVQAPDGNRIWSPDRGVSLYVMTSDSVTKKSGVWKVHLDTGKTNRLYGGNEYDAYSYHPPVGMSDGRHLIFRAERVDASEDLWIADAAFRHRQRLTNLNPMLVQHTFGRSRLINFLSADGHPLHGALLLPADYVEGRQYPLVVFVYSGVLGSDWLNSFGLSGSWFNMQILSNRGYAVLWPDVPVHLGTPMQDLMNTVAPAINRVVELGIADPNRLVVMGHSNGGYSAMTLLTQTRRFKAAVVCDGFGDLAAMYGIMTPDGAGRWIPLLERSIPSMGAPPWKVPLRYVQNSPIFSLDRVQTPLIIEVGGADAGGFVAMSEELFVGLKRLERDVTYLRYDGEGHQLRQIPNLIDFWNRVLAFFAVHLENTLIAPTERSPTH